MTNRRRDVLRILADSDVPMSLADIADRLDVHVNTVRFHIDALVSTGQVQQVEPTRGTTGRPAQQFRAVRRMNPEGPRQFQLLAGMLASGLSGVPDGARRARQAGVAVGRELAEEAGRADAADALVGLLDDLGFEAERAGDEIRLHSCPFLELAENDSPIVCQAHLGLMRGAARSWDPKLRVTRLIPFVEPDLCVARLKSGDSA